MNVTEPPLTLPPIQMALIMNDEDRLKDMRERMRKLRAERKARGFKKVACYVMPNDKERLVKYVKRLGGEVGA